MQTVALAVGINTQDAPGDGPEERHTGLRLVPRAEEQALLSQRQTVHVCFPVLVPGGDGRIIPFGKYELAVSLQHGSQSTTPEEAVLANLDNGPRVALSVQELTAIARDPDFEML